MTWQLVTLDLDGTLLPDDTVFAAVLRGAGLGDEVATSDARFYSGELSLEDCFWEQWAMVKPLTLAAMHRGLRQAAWLADIHTGVQQLHAAGVRVCLLTDQPSVLTDFLGRWGLADAICSPVTVVEGMATDMDGRFDKLANLTARLDAWNIPASAVCHVGNGENDVPVWQAVGGSVAVYASPDVAKSAKVDLGRPSSFLEIAQALTRA